MSLRRRDALILGAAGIAATAAGFLVGPALLRLGAGGEGEALWAAQFPDLEGKVRQLTEWRGKILVCNFWATWCTPCREEIPLLVAAREKYGLQGVEIVGIAIDNPVNVRDYSASFKIPYPVLLAGADGLDLMHQLGNNSGGLPYTVVTDRLGELAHRKLGAMRQSEVEAILGPLARI